MTPMHQPVKTSQVFHNLTIDGSDDELTRFVEWIEREWVKNNQTALNITNVMWDNGHDVLRFETNCDTIQLNAHIENMSNHFKSMFIMYDFYTGENEPNYQEGVHWFYDVKMQHRPENFK